VPDVIVPARQVDVLVEVIRRRVLLGRQDDGGELVGKGSDDLELMVGIGEACYGEEAGRSLGEGDGRVGVAAEVGGEARKVWVGQRFVIRRGVLKGLPRGDEVWDRPSLLPDLLMERMLMGWSLRRILRVLRKRR
jgi:hypothetical protein